MQKGTEHTEESKEKISKALNKGRSMKWSGVPVTEKEYIRYEKGCEALGKGKSGFIRVCMDYYITNNPIEDGSEGKNGKI